MRPALGDMLEGSPPRLVPAGRPSPSVAASHSSCTAKGGSRGRSAHTSLGRENGRRGRVSAEWFSLSVEHHARVGRYSLFYFSPTERGACAARGAAGPVRRGPRRKTSAAATRVPFRPFGPRGPGSPAACSMHTHLLLHSRALAVPGCGPGRGPGPRSPGSPRRAGSSWFTATAVRGGGLRFRCDGVPATAGPANIVYTNEACGCVGAPAAQRRGGRGQVHPPHTTTPTRTGRSSRAHDPALPAGGHYGRAQDGT